jgi:SDR family mycofactocin-dependent oxidoreductase
MGRLDGKVAFITGAGMGQGRSHARVLASEGAKIIAVDICEQIDSVNLYELASKAELDETARLVEEAGGSIVALKADVRSTADLEAAVAAGLDAFGRIDICCANAAIANVKNTPMWEVSDRQWQDIIDVNLTGAWRTAKAVIPTMISQRSGSIIFTSSAAFMRSSGWLGGYVPSKAGLAGLMRELAIELGQYTIRVNTLHPGNVGTRMGMAFAPDKPAGAPQAQDGAGVLPIPGVEVVDLSNAILFLGSDESRYVTGSEFRVDAGWPLRSTRNAG